MLSVTGSTADFFYTRVTPMVFEKIMKDHEDDKVDILLNGFENCVKNEITNYDEILYFFDMISSLRVCEIRRFFNYYGINGEEPAKIIDDTSEGMLLKAADRKLNSLNLVKFGSNNEWKSFEDGTNHLNFYVDSDDGLIRSKISKTYTGEELIKFIGYNI